MEISGASHRLDAKLSYIVLLKKSLLESKVYFSGENVDFCTT